MFYKLVGTRLGTNPNANFVSLFLKTKCQRQSNVTATDDQSFAGHSMIHPYLAFNMMTRTDAPSVFPLIFGLKRAINFLSERIQVDFSL